RKVSQPYDLIHPNANDTLTVRSLFIIDPNKKIRLIITYPASTGRNFHEILRVVDSLQLTDNYKVATPANWQDGDEVVIVPSLQDPEEIARRFPKGYRAVKPYLRLTPQPNRQQACNRHFLNLAGVSLAVPTRRAEPLGIRASPFWRLKPNSSHPPSLTGPTGSSRIAGRRQAPVTWITSHSGRNNEHRPNLLFF